MMHIVLTVLLVLGLTATFVLAIACGVVWLGVCINAGMDRAHQEHVHDIHESVRLTVTSTAEAIGKAVQTAQFAPADPVPPRREQTLEHALDPDIAEGTIDTSDPTDGATWLRRERVDAVRLEGNEPYGIPGLKVRRP